mgnify:CR=1 FL=1
MKYKMYDEMMEQPEAIRKTFASELENMENISKLIENVDVIYLIGCGSSISTCYSVKSALNSVCDLNVEVFTGYEFVYNKKLTIDENSVCICASQSGETADTLAALRRANEFNIATVSISNEPDSSMIKEAKYPIITLGDRETAILGTKTYITQLACLYQILFAASDYDKKDEILDLQEHTFTLPNSWIWCSLGQISKVITDGTHKTPNYVEKGVPFISIANIIFC